MQDIRLPTGSRR